MEPIWGLVIYLVCLTVVCDIVRKRGRPMWPYLIGTPAASFLAVVLTARTGGSSTAGGFIAFAPILAAMIISLSTRTASQMAADHGSYRGIRKCPMCAESIKAEARKCKHCGSEVPA